MEIFQVLVNGEEEKIREAYSLLQELGFSAYNENSLDAWIRNEAHYLIAGYLSGKIEWNNREDQIDDCKELTLPQLQALVAQSKSKVREYLDPNDNYKLCLINPADAAHWMIEVPESADCLMQWPTGHKVFYRDNFTESWNNAYKEWHFVRGDDGVDQSKTLWKRPIQDPALISGAEALADIANVQHTYEDRDDWYTTQYSTLTIQEVLKGETTQGVKISFRLKPQTIKIELELPKPFEPNVGEEVFYINDTNKRGYCVDEHQAHYNYNFGVWRTEDEIKQVVEQLRKIRGTNS